MEGQENFLILRHHIMSCTNKDVYDKDIFTKYSKEEIDKANGYIDHDRDFLFTYAGLTASSR